MYMAKKHNTTKKHNSRRKLKGGLKIKTPGITSWQAIVRMLNVPHARLTKIAYSSLKGFIFRLDVPHMPENSEFYGLNKACTDYTNPVYSLIFKFAIFGEDANDLELPPLIIPGDRDDNGVLLKRKGRAKETEDPNSFKKEAKLQQAIYRRTVPPNGKPICLAVVDFSTFDKPSSDGLLRKLLTLAADDVATRMLNYLISNVTPGRRLGLLTMELANPEFRELKFVPEPAKDLDSIYALAQLIILFVKLRILNYDCHDKNVLASRAPPEAAGDRAVLIDFGRTLNFNEADPFPVLSAAEYPDDAERAQYMQDDRTNVQELYKRFSGGGDLRTNYAEIVAAVPEITSLYPRTIRGSTKDPMIKEAEEEESIRKMNNIIKFMACVDYATNNTYFVMTQGGPQMIALLSFLYGTGFSVNWGSPVEGDITQPPRPPDFELTPTVIAKYSQILDIIMQLTGSSSDFNRVSETAMTSGVLGARLFKIEDNESYDRSGVPLAGGKRRTRKIRKTRKNTTKKSRRRY
jgi:hypothetical protein